MGHYTTKGPYKYKKRPGSVNKRGQLRSLNKDTKGNR